MKSLLLVLFAIGGGSAFAKETFTISVDCPGTVRVGKYFGDAVSVAFETILTLELANELIAVRNNSGYENYLDGSLKCAYKFNKDTFYSWSHKANMEMTLTRKSDGTSVVKKFECNALVNDGGNQTLKQSCAKKIAKEVRIAMDGE